ncbi:MAG: Hsp20 family protein [Patescibacteria group bacterium]|jgi:HSP20 family protein
MDDKDFPIEIRIKDWRKKRDLSQEALAEHLGISRQSIISLESGRSMPSLPLAVSLCQFFDTAFEDIFEFEHEIEKILIDESRDGFAAPNPQSLTPKIDILDSKDAIVVRVELPGMKEEDINVEIMDNVMTIAGEYSDNEEHYYYKESHTGRFERSFTLPAEVVADKAEAEMKDGILSITVPKAEPKKAQKITVKKK